MVQISDPSIRELLTGRYIASVATQDADSSIHLVAVWYYFDGQNIYLATSSRTHKAQNLRRSSRVSLMIDSRHPATQKGICIRGTARMLEGEASQPWRDEVHRKYLSAEALADPKVGPVFRQWDDLAIQIAPQSVIRWDMNELDRQAFGGAFQANPDYLLPISF